MSAQGSAASAQFFLLSGKDPFLQDEHLRRLRAQHAHEGLSDTDYQEFRSGEHSPGQVIDFLRTAPFLSSGRMAAYRDVDRLEPESRQDLLGLVEVLPPHSVLVLVSGANPNKRDPFHAALGKKGRTLSCQPPYEEKLPEWLCARAKSEGASMNRSAAEAVIGRAGKDLASICGALERLRLYVHPRTTIERGDVEALLGSTAEEDVFALAARVLESDGPGAVRVLERLYDDGLGAVEIVAVLGGQIERLYRAALARQAGMSRAEWSAGVKGHPYFLEKLWNQAGTADAGRLAGLLKELAAADEAYKTGRLDETVGLECLVIRSCVKS